MTITEMTTSALTVLGVVGLFVGLMVDLPALFRLLRGQSSKKVAEPSGTAVVCGSALGAVIAAEMILHAPTCADAGLAACDFAALADMADAAAAADVASAAQSAAALGDVLSAFADILP